MLAKPTGTVMNPPKQTTEDIFLEMIIDMTLNKIRGSLIKKINF